MNTLLLEDIKTLLNGVWKSESNQLYNFNNDRLIVNDKEIGKYILTKENHRIYLNFPTYDLAMRLEIIELSNISLTTNNSLNDGNLIFTKSS